MNMFEDVFNDIDTVVVQVLNNSTANVISLISPLILAGFGIYMILIAVTYMRDSAPLGSSFSDLFKRIFAWGVIISFGLNISFYIGTVVPIVNGIPSDLGNAILGGTTSTTNGLDAVVTQYTNAISDMWNKASGISDSIVVGFNAFFLIVFGMTFTAIAFAYLALAKVFIAILLVIGPVFFACALFPTTRQYFSTWVSQIVNYGLIGVLFNITAAVQIKLLDLMLARTPLLTAGLKDFLALDLVGLAFLVIALKLPDLAQSLSGGMSLGGSIGGAVRSATGVGRLSKALMSKNQSPPPAGGSIKPEAGGK